MVIVFLIGLVSEQVAGLTYRRDKQVRECN